MEIKNHKILLIDDDPIVLKSFARLLTIQKFDTITASNYEEAIKAIQNESFDLVVSDIRMPGKNGVETVADIQKNLKSAGKGDLPIIFITGYAEFGDQLNATFLGEILTKPVDSEILLRTIRDYL